MLFIPPTAKNKRTVEICRNKGRDPRHVPPLQGSTTSHSLPKSLAMLTHNCCVTNRILDRLLSACCHPRDALNGLSSNPSFLASCPPSSLAAVKQLLTHSIRYSLDASVRVLDCAVLCSPGWYRPAKSPLGPSTLDHDRTPWQAGNVDGVPEALQL